MATFNATLRVSSAAAADLAALARDRHTGEAAVSAFAYGRKGDPTPVHVTIRLRDGEPVRGTDAAAAAAVVDAIRSVAADRAAARVAAAVRAEADTVTAAKVRLASVDADADPAGFVKATRALEDASKALREARAAAREADAEHPCDHRDAAEVLESAWADCRRVSFPIPGMSASTTLSAVLTRVRPGDVGRAFATAARAKAAKASGRQANGRKGSASAKAAKATKAAAPRPVRRAA